MFGVFRYVPTERIYFSHPISKSYHAIFFSSLFEVGLLGMRHQRTQKSLLCCVWISCLSYIIFFNGYANHGV